MGRGLRRRAGYPAVTVIVIDHAKGILAEEASDRAGVLHYLPILLQAHDQWRLEAHAGQALLDVTVHRHQWPMNPRRGRSADCVCRPA
jgi:hypothetical protein